MGFERYEKQLNKALKSAGNKHLYQHIIIGLLCLLFFLNIFLIVGPSIYFMDPVFVCNSRPGGTEDESYACDNLASCTVVNSFTIVYKMKLYCAQQYKRSIIQSSLSIGSLLGLIIMNVVSDLKGRRFALLVDLLLAITSSFLTYIGAEFQIVPLLVLASVLSGFSGYSLMVISYIILGDICEEQLRQKSTIYVNLALSLGLCLLSFVYSWCNRWYTIIILFMFIPLLAIALFVYIFVEQSPNHHLFVEGNQAQCVRVLHRIAKINGMGYVECEKIKYFVSKISKQIAQAEQGHKEGRSERQASRNRNKSKNLTLYEQIINSITKWKYLKVILCVSIVQSGSNLCFYGLEYAINDVGYSYGFNNLLIGLVEAIVSLVVGHYVMKLPRKKTLMLMYGVTPIFTLFFVFDDVQQSAFLCSVLIGLMRACTMAGYFMIVMIETQSFPLEIQSIGAGSIEGLSQLGSFVAPLLNAFSINHGLPKITVMGVAMLICLLPVVFVPESSSIEFKKEVKKTEQLRKVKSEAPYY